MGVEDDVLTTTATMIETLRPLFLFAAFSDEQLEWVAAAGDEVTFEAGAPIITEGAPADAFYVLLGGESVTIDTRPGAKTVTKQDGSSLFGQLAFPPQLWSLAQGSNSVRIEFTGASASASAVTLSYFKRYLSA